MITGMIRPSFACAWVWALNCLQNSMMLTPCWPSAGPMGGAGFALPAGICSFTCPVTFFIASPHRGPCGRAALPRLNTLSGATCSARPTSTAHLSSGARLLHLHEVQLHRGRPAEDGHQHLHPALVRIHLFHRPVEVAERAVDDPDGVALLELHLGFGLQRPLGAVSYTHLTLPTSDL